ncbi:MAG: hypothetical protein A3F13_07405 [Gammaproteobacteria bacterium RIFCSPHIGHO2_12_FULL_40_19]|nr:MAG: hypothetical protein A3F13_07405 [Gammaproteobacteria bacterium RIFCSPHIGHO2_12_FULL_40_19]
MANNRFPLELLPDAVQLEIEQYLSSSDKANVAMACQATLQNAKRLDQNGYADKSLGIDLIGKQALPFFNSRIHAMQKKLYQAGLYILKGRIDEALAIIDKDPDLLLQVIPAITLQKHPSCVGEKHVGRTLFQLALGAYDHELYEAIGQRIESKYGHDVKAKQFNDQFPNGVKNAKSFCAVFDSLIKTIAADTTIAFINGQNIMNDTTRAALQALTKSLAPTDGRTTGVHLDLQIIIDCIDTYEDGFDKFKNEDKKWNQRGCYWRCVFGLIESRAPYFVAMALNEKDAFFDVMEGKKKVTRSTEVLGDSDFFDSQLAVSRYIIGGGRGGVERGVGVAYLARRCGALKTFVRRTHTNIDNLSGSCSNQQTISCKK